MLVSHVGTYINASKNINIHLLPSASIFVTSTAENKTKKKDKTVVTIKFGDIKKTAVIGLIARVSGKKEEVPRFFEYSQLSLNDHDLFS